MNRKESLKKFEEYLVIKNYRPMTKFAYSYALGRFFDYCQSTVSTGDKLHDYARSYIVYRFGSGKSWHTVNIDYSAIASFCRYVMGLDWDYKMIPRPRGERRLSTVLSANQTEVMINRTMNIKHRLILILLYTSGVRNGELLSMKLTDVLLDRQQLKVTLGKGAKDRIVNIPETTVKAIKKYMEGYKPDTYLIEGMYEGRKYSASSLSKVINQAKDRAEIQTKVSAHTFRYTYATHQIESGTDLVTLQHQLGHSHISTTMKYIQLCQTQPRIINHPIENLNIKRL